MKLQTERDCVKYSLMAEVRMTCTQVSVKIKSDDVMLIDTILFFRFSGVGNYRRDEKGTPPRLVPCLPRLSPGP